MVVQPGKGVREFESGEEAVDYLVRNEGYAKLYGPDGNLLMTKGKPPEDA